MTESIPSAGHNCRISTSTTRTASSAGRGPSWSLPRAFTASAAAIRKKLVIEIADLAPGDAEWTGLRRAPSFVLRADHQGRAPSFVLPADHQRRAPSFVLPADHQGRVPSFVLPADHQGRVPSFVLRADHQGRAPSFLLRAGLEPRASSPIPAVSRTRGPGRNPCTGSRAPHCRAQQASPRLCRQLATRARGCFIEE